MPNVIHSLDAAHIVGLLTNPLVEDLTVFTIHDCFGSVAADSFVVQQIVKKEFVSIYSDKNFLNSFHSGCIASIKTYDPTRYEIDDDGKHVIDKKSDAKYAIPKLPALGDLDINSVLDSTYMVKP